MAINAAQQARVDALEAKRAATNNTNTTTKSNSMSDLLSTPLTKNSTIDKTSTNTNNKSSTNFIGNDPSSYKTDTQTQINKDKGNIVNNQINPQDLKTEDEAMFERDVQNMGYDAATEFMGKRNQTFADEANKAIDSLVDGGQRTITDEDIYSAISTSVSNSGGQIKDTDDWNNTIQDIRNRMNIGTNIQNYIDTKSSAAANAYVAGEFVEGEQPASLEEKLDAYIKSHGGDATIEGLSQNIELVDKYDEYVNTDEYKELSATYAAQTKEMADLVEAKRTLTADTKKDYSGLSDSQIANIVADRTDDINNQIIAKQAELTQTYQQSEVLRGLGEGKLAAYTDEFTTNMKNDLATLNLVKGIATQDWTKDWALRTADFNKNTTKELSQLAILEQYDLKDVADNFVDDLDVSDYVKDVLNFRKELDSNLDRKLTMTKDDDGNIVFYDDYGNIVNSMDSDSTPETPASFMNYEPTDKTTLEDGIGLLISSNSLTDSLKQCGEGVNDWLQEIGATDKNLFLDPIEQKNTVLNSEIPEVGSVVVFDPTGSSRGDAQEEKYGFVAGHVAIVTALNEDGSIARIGHWNKSGDKKYTEETLPAGRDKYISGYFDPSKEVSTESSVELTSEDILAASSLAKEIMGAVWARNEDNIKLITDQMLEGKTIDEIEDNLRFGTYGNDFGGVVKDAFDSIASFGGKTDTIVNRARELLEDKITKYGIESDEVKNEIKQIAKNTMDTESKKSLQGNELLVTMLDNIGDDLKAFEDAGGKTNIFEGTAQQISEKIGEEGNPELAKMANKIQKVIQTYRRAISGAAFTESESLEYKSIFPSIGNTEELNSALIDSLREVTNLDIDNSYGFVMGNDKYENMYKNIIDTEDNTQDDTQDNGNHYNPFRTERDEIAKDFSK